MKQWMLRLFVLCGMLSLLLRAAPLLAQSAAKCDGTLSGYKLSVFTQYSNVGTTEVVCNYSVQTTDPKDQKSAGLAITVDYGCPDDIKQAWASKTGPQPKWDDVANPPVMAGELARTANSLLLREDLGPYTGYAGTFFVEEKLFTLINAQTTATIFVMTDPKDSSKPLDVVLPAEKALALAYTIADAHHDLAAKLSCSNPPPTSESQFPAPPPALAKITSSTGMVISIKRASRNGGPTEWQQNVDAGTELEYGDTFCFRGEGQVQLTWYDGTVITMEDPHTEGSSERGIYTECFGVNLKPLPNVTAPGPIEGKILNLIGGAARLIRKAASGSAPNAPGLEVDTKAAKVTDKGTTFVVVNDPTGGSLICLEDGGLQVTPHNTSLKSFALPVGNQVTITDSAVGDVKPGCTLPASTTLPQPNLAATAMTLQAAQRFVVAGDNVLIPIWLINGQNLANLNFQITYDPAVIQPAGDIAKGNLLDNALFQANPAQAGAVLVGLAQTSALNGTGTILNIPFHIVGKAGDVSPLLLTVTTINDPNGGGLPIDLIAGQITIVNDDGTLPPIPGGTNGGSNGGNNGTTNGASNGGTNTGTGTNNGIQQGDCDGDSHLSELDALCALEMSTASRTSHLFMDMDGDGSVTSRDAVIILQRVVGE